MYETSFIIFYNISLKSLLLLFHNICYYNKYYFNIFVLHIHLFKWMIRLHYSPLSEIKYQYYHVRHKNYVIFFSLVFRTYSKLNPEISVYDR